MGKLALLGAGSAPYWAAAERDWFVPAEESVWPKAGWKRSRKPLGCTREKVRKALRTSTPLLLLASVQPRASAMPGVEELPARGAAVPLAGGM